MDELKDIFQWNEFRYIKSVTGEGCQITIVEYCGAETTVTFPAYIDESPVIAIGDGNVSVFKNSSNVETTVVPKGITKINARAFLGSRKLKKMLLPSSVSSIGEAVFCGCKKLKTIKLPAINEISDDLFRASGISKINLPDSVIKIGKRSFEATDLQNIVIPDNCEIIESYAFSCCRKLKVIDLPNKLKAIGRSAFEGCQELISITIPDSIRVIEDYLFCGCTNLTMVNLSTNTEIIKEGCFELCIGLISIELPEGVLSIGKKAFKLCENLPKIIFPASLKTVGMDAFSGCKKLYSIRCNAQKLHIEPYAFDNTIWFERQNNGPVYFNNTLISFKGECTQNQLIIRDGTVYISDFALLSLNFEDLILPDGLEEIGNQAFAMCRELKHIRFPESLKYIGEKTCYECNSLTEITVPEKCMEIGEKAFLREDTAEIQKVYICGAETVLKDKSIGYKLMEVKKKGSKYGSIEEVPDPKVTIFAADNSNAQKYAVDNGLTFERISTHAQDSEQ